jgi:hypothetical protein
MVARRASFPLHGKRPKGMASVSNLLPAQSANVE